MPASSWRQHSLVLALALASIASDCHWRLRINNPDGRSTLVIIVSTGGIHLDVDGYSLAVTGLEAGEVADASIPTNGTQLIYLTAAGAHLVELRGVAENCTVLTANPHRIDVPVGSSAETSFEVSCTSR